MPRNSSGTYTLPKPPFVPDTTISSSDMNSDLSDIAVALTGSLPINGTASMTGVLSATTGSAATPSYAFSADSSTGFYFTAPHQLNFAVGGVQIANLSSAGFQINSGNYLDSTGSVLNSIPIGTVADFAGFGAPAKWLFCAGQAVSRTTYSALFAVLGTWYGVGDGVTTFNLPDCRGRATYGCDGMGGVAAGRISVGGLNFDGTILGNSGGLQYHFLTTGEMPVHSHGVNDPTHGHPYNTFGSTFNQYDTGAQTANNTVVGGNTSASATGISIQNAGGGAAHSILGPAIMFQKIIFANA